jgi:hypothetical protein
MRAHLVLGVAVSLLASSQLFGDDDPEAAFKRGVELLQKQEFKDAIPLLKQAEKSSPMRLRSCGTSELPAPRPGIFPRRWRTGRSTENVNRTTGG